MDIGNITELTREELENAIYLQMRAMDNLASWYLRAVELKDQAVFPHQDYIARRAELVQVAITDANAAIAFEERQNQLRDALAERNQNNDRERQLRGVNEQAQPPSNPPV